MPETLHSPNRTCEVIGTAASGGGWLDADSSHTLTSLNDGPGAMSGILQFGLDHPNNGHFAVTVGLHDNNDPWCNVITRPLATQSAESILELYNPEGVQDVIKGQKLLHRDVTSADEMRK